MQKSLRRTACNAGTERGKAKIARKEKATEAASTRFPILANLRSYATLRAAAVTAVTKDGRSWPPSKINQA